MILLRKTKELASVKLEIQMIHKELMIKDLSSIFEGSWLPVARRDGWLLQREFIWRLNLKNNTDLGNL